MKNPIKMCANYKLPLCIWAGMGRPTQQETLIKIQQQLELVKQKYSDKERQCYDLDDKNKQLAHEKWALEQEKHQLLAQLKQMKFTKGFSK